MCQSRSSTEVPYGNQANRFAKVDKCMTNQIKKLNESGIPTLSCCCGHRRYKKTIVVLCKDGKTRIEFFSKKIIPRYNRFYVKCKKGKNKGYYYISECR